MHKDLQKKKKQLLYAKQQLARASRLFAHFFVLFALRRENA